MNLQIYEGKKVRIIDVDGQEFEGIISDYIYPEDNAPEEKEAVVLEIPNRNDYIEFLDEDIQTIYL